VCYNQLTLTSQVVAEEVMSDVQRANPLIFCIFFFFYFNFIEVFFLLQKLKTSFVFKWKKKYTSNISTEEVNANIRKCKYNYTVWNGAQRVILKVHLLIERFKR
jgi:hypothetical protein